MLLLADRLDEWVMQHLTEHEGKRSKTCVAARSILTELGARAAGARDRQRTKQLLKRVKRVLRERVDEVRVGGRLRQSAACLVLSEHDLGYQMRELPGRGRPRSRRRRFRVSS